MSKRSRHIRTTLRRGPTEAGYAFFRARRRRRNVADEEPELRAADLDLEDLEANAEVLRAYAALDALEVGSVQWFLPWFHLATGGGVHTALRLAAHLADRHGVAQRFCIYDREDTAGARDVGGEGGRGLPRARRRRRSSPPGRRSRDADAAIATTWESAFSLVRFRAARAKFFLVQDWEPDFHPAGSLSAMLGEAARLGIPGLVNTSGLADAYRAAGSPAVAFTPAVDPRYRPPEAPREPGAPVRVFFYGRPATPRNAFSLGLAALRRVKARFGDRVEIVCAGGDWSPGQYGVADVLENRGSSRTSTRSRSSTARATSGSCSCSRAIPPTSRSSSWPAGWRRCPTATRTPPGCCATRRTRCSPTRCPRSWPSRWPASSRTPACASGWPPPAGPRSRGARWDDELERVWGAMTKPGPRFE